MRSNKKNMSNTVSQNTVNNICKEAGSCVCERTMCTCTRGSYKELHNLLNKLQTPVADFFSKSPPQAF